MTPFHRPARAPSSASLLSFLTQPPRSLLSLRTPGQADAVECPNDLQRGPSVLSLPINDASTEGLGVDAASYEALPREALPELILVELLSVRIAQWRRLLPHPHQSTYESRRSKDVWTRWRQTE